VSEGRVPTTRSFVTHAPRLRHYAPASALKKDQGDTLAEAGGGARLIGNEVAVESADGSTRTPI
jgi:hypothetical protein